MAHGNMQLNIDAVVEELALQISFSLLAITMGGCWIINERCSCQALEFVDEPVENSNEFAHQHLFFWGITDITIRMQVLANVGNDPASEFHVGIKLFWIVRECFAF